MFYCKVLLLLAATTDVFGYSLRKSPEVGIVGGHPVRISDVPYMANLHRKDGYHWCSASIVAYRFVLTSAYCIEPNVTYIVTVGSEYAHKGYKYEIEKVFLHEKSAESTDYNIALVKLAKALTFGPNVQPIDIAGEPFEMESGFPLNVTGWGRTGVTERESEILRQVTLPFLAESECKKVYPDRITDKTICAGIIEGGEGPCYGDGGSPLVLYDYKGGVDVQVGIASFNTDCDHNPGVYTKLSSFEQWIRDTVKTNS